MQRHLRGILDVFGEANTASDFRASALKVEGGNDMKNSSTNHIQSAWNPV